MLASFSIIIDALSLLVFHQPKRIKAIVLVGGTLAWGAVLFTGGNLLLRALIQWLEKK